MSMIFELRRVSAEQAESLTQDPSDIFFFLSGSELYQPPKPFFKRLFAPKQSAKPVRSWAEPAQGSVLELDTNWHVLHYFLTRTAWEANLPHGSLMGGIQLGDVDVGYGPARLLTPIQIDEFLVFLENLQSDNFGSNITGEELEQNEIYGGYAGWNAEDTSKLWGYVEELKLFLAGAKHNRESIVMHLF